MYHHSTKPQFQQKDTSYNYNMMWKGNLQNGVLQIFILNSYTSHFKFKKTNVSYKLIATVLCAIGWSQCPNDFSENGSYLMIIYLIKTPNVKNSGNNAAVLVGRKFSIHMVKLAASRNGQTQAPTCSPVVSKHVVKLNNNWQNQCSMKCLTIGLTYPFFIDQN